jgi:hypothetical protein
MTDTDHASRAYHAGEALNAYCNACGMTGNLSETVTDLIADLLHLLGTYEGRASALQALGMAKSHYNKETDA